MEQLGVVVQQQAGFPASPNSTTELTVTVLPTPSPAPAPPRAVQFTMAIRVPGWLTQAGSVRVNGQEAGGALKAGSYLQLNRTWRHNDKVTVHFPLSLWTAPLNDYHPDYNGTMSFMYGPLVLAGVDMQSDIWVPKGNQFKSDPSSFIRRNSTSVLEFEATAADGSLIRMIPLRDVMEEQYVAYFMTAGSKPAQPPVYYCPHSHNEEASGHGMDWHVKDGVHAWKHH